MNLRGIDFGPVLGASGVQGFFGEGYWHHKYLRPLGLNFDGCTFVAKTTTLNPRSGNMPLQNEIVPTELFPKCIKVYFRQKIMLNAVGLSGPGAKALFETGRWQARRKPFFISFMSVASTPEERFTELSQFVDLAQEYLPNFQTKIGLQINFSCPNVGLHPDELVSEIEEALDRAANLDIPLMPKLNVLVPESVAKQICENPNCDAICVSNTIPWGKLPDKINWKKLFGTDISPLAKFGGGGLSGWPLLQLVDAWVDEARWIGITKPINAGGGILSPRDVETLYRTGTSSVFIGSVANLRPWRVPSIINQAHKLF